ncbi:D-alanyl-D-alanine carboxypeptidase/D-alanyl-D-alanine endopeptidase [Varibaculum vaginae]|uniref:D-alanyl-D-alanine carboxypeptidase/D-alanyl-D-alanine endopeptidase n=1 Tax=Varibaculum vaginae TaxID=2364797 RepID=UPI000F08875F|nr:D-alanyl-D-alanine carboxypeptidase/D-alanyl-D-alanine-endopeptidase [Varibaculum vaginae]
MRKSVLLPLMLLFALLLGGVGYGILDAYNVVPGVLTLEKRSVNLPDTVQLQLSEKQVADATGITTKARPITAEQVKPLLDKLTAEAARSADVSSQTEDDEATPANSETRVGAVVIDTASGKIIADLNGEQALTPASSTKVIAAATALRTLGPQYRFTTSAHLADKKLYLRGNGDQLLSAGAGNPTAITGHAGLGDLAAKTAQKLKKKKINSVQLFLDESVFGEQTLLPNWVEQGNSNYETKPVPLAIRNGLAHPELTYGYVEDPALTATQEFATRLKEQGIETGEVERAVTPKEATKVAQVESAPLHEVIHDTLKESNNMLAEVLCRASAVKAGTGANFPGEIKVAQKVLGDLKLEAKGFENQDCSGLSTENKIKPILLASVTQKAARGGDLKLRSLVSSLPVSALDGTLYNRYVGLPSAGNVRAKTGYVQAANTLTGLVATKTGRVLTFCVMIDSSQHPIAGGAIKVIDNFVDGLAEL